MGSGEHLQVTVESVQHVKTVLLVDSMDTVGTERSLANFFLFFPGTRWSPLYYLVWLKGLQKVQGKRKKSAIKKKS